jgi:MerR family transcriptional regulator, light-induced transcriptional regulator
MGSMNKKTPAGQASLLGMNSPPPTDEARRGPQSGLLARAVESEIIPRLVRAHGSSPAPQRPNGPQVTDDDVRHLTDQVLHAEDHVLQEYISDLRRRGISVQSIFLDLLAPVARRLGEQWSGDTCSFTEVTVAMGRLQQLLRANSSAFGMAGFAESPPPDRRILLLPCPGEQHTFGLSLVAEFFYRAGWDVSTSFVQPTGSLSALVEREWFDVVGLSLGHTGQVRRLDDCVHQIRRASMNPRVLILVGGVAFSLDPQLADQVSADAVIADAASAPHVAAALLSQTSLQL